jgi:hypothetical protein
MIKKLEGALVAVLILSGACTAANAKDAWKEYEKSEKKRAKEEQKFERKQEQEWEKYQRKQAKKGESNILRPGW